jgi:hypothetical protein
MVLGIAAYQAFGWLRTGVWTNVSLGSILSYEPDDDDSTSWKGLAALINWLLSTPLVFPFAMGAGGILAAVFWKRWNQQRPHGSEGTAIIVATWLAAIAAGLSSIAAFRQEKATFTNSLYTKQVDTFASLLAKASNLRKYLDDLNAVTLHNTDARVKSFSDTEMASFFVKVRETDKIIAPLVDELDQIANQVFLVTPNPMQRQVRRLKQQFDNFKYETKGIVDYMESERAAFDRKKYPSNLSAVFHDFSRHIDYTGNLFLNLEIEINRCAFGLFVEGRFLSVPSLRECALTFPPDPD